MSVRRRATGADADADADTADQRQAQIVLLYPRKQVCVLDNTIYALKSSEICWRTKPIRTGPLYPISLCHHQNFLRTGSILYVLCLEISVVIDSSSTASTSTVKEEKSAVAHWLLTGSISDVTMPCLWWRSTSLHTYVVTETHNYYYYC